MKKLIIAIAAVALSISAFGYTAKCHIDIPGMKPIIVVGEVTELEDGIVVIRTQFRTYRTHMARVVIVRENVADGE